MNTPVNFEIAKLLKEKGFKNETANYYFEDGEYREGELTGTNGYYGEDYSFSQSEFLENWNSDWITTKDGSRCFGCSKDRGYFETYSAPTIAEVVMWLYDTHGIWIYAKRGYGWEFIIETTEILHNDGTFYSPTEAYSDAILYTLNNFLI